MRPTTALLTAPARRMPAGAACVMLVYLAGIALPLAGNDPALVAVLAMATFFWHLMAGFTLRGMLRPETLLLPGFRRHLAFAASIDALVMLVVPAALVVALGAGDHALLALGGLSLIAAIGLASGTGMRAALLFWLVFVAVGWMPELAADLGRDAARSPLTPLGLVLIAVLLSNWALRPLLTISDREIEDSPLQAGADGRKPMLGADGTARPRGFVGRRLNSLFDGSAQRALAAALARHRRSPSATARMALIRAVLLPHDNPSAIGLRFLWVALIATVYFFATHAATRWNAGYVGAYAVMIGIGRFSAVGQGMRRMRPNLADLYLTLAPRTHREFQATMADALLWLVAVSVFNCVAYGGLVALLLHAGEPMRLVLAAGIAGVAGAFAALAVHMVGPESPTGRAIAQIVLLVGALAAYTLCYWLLGRFGLLPGGLGAVVLTLPFGLGAWHAARTDYLRRTPRFDAPIT